MGSELLKRLEARIERSRSERGDMLFYGSPDPMLVELRDALTRSRTITKEQVEEAIAALEPFARFAARNVGEDGWEGLGCQRERIVDWFGPTDFRLALLAVRAFGLTVEG